MTPEFARVAAENSGDGFKSRSGQNRQARDGEAGNFRILIVEDEYLTALSVRYALERERFEILGVVASAAEALAAVERDRPDLVLMDVRLSGQVDGIDAALELYRRFGVRCVFATAHVDLSTRARAAPARPMGWLSKPYSDKQLLRTLEEACSEFE
ncbi:MAG: response regulator [Alphaproteobacteria bacterium]